MFLDWNNRNSFIKYPFEDSCSLTNTDGSFTLIPKIIVDLIVNGLPPNRNYYLARTQWVANTRELQFVFQDFNGDNFAFNSIILPTGVTDSTQYATFKFQTEDLQVCGRCVVNLNNAFSLWNSLADTTHYFTPASTSFLLGVLVPEEAAVTSLTAVSYHNLGTPQPIYFDPLQGKVKIKEGYNVSVTVDPSDNSIVISSSPGAGKGSSCDNHLICHRLTDVDQDGSDEKLCGLDKAIATLNGTAAANEHCTVFIKGDDCIRIWKYPGQNMIAIHNECIGNCDVRVLMWELECRIGNLQEAFGITASPAYTAACTKWAAMQKNPAQDPSKL